MSLADEFARRPNLPGPNLCDLAIVFSLSSAAVAAGEKVPDRAKLAEEYAARAVEFLVRARDSGFFRNNPRAASRIATDESFTHLRGRSDFKTFLSKIEDRTPSAVDKKQ